MFQRRTAKNCGWTIGLQGKMLGELLSHQLSLFLRNVLRSVQELENDLGSASNEDRWEDHLDLIIDSVNKCMKEVKEIGKMELKLPNKSISRTGIKRVLKEVSTSACRLSVCIWKTTAETHKQKHTIE
jgi:hexokinase